MPDKIVSRFICFLGVACTMTVFSCNTDKTKGLQIGVILGVNKIQGTCGGGFLMADSSIFLPGQGQVPLDLTTNGYVATGYLDPGGKYPTHTLRIFPPFPSGFYIDANSVFPVNVLFAGHLVPNDTCNEDNIFQITRIMLASQATQ